MREDAILLLDRLRELAKKNIVIDTFLREVEASIRVGYLPSIPSQEYVDDVIIDQHIIKIVERIIIFQTLIIEQIEAK